MDVRGRAAKTVIDEKLAPAVIGGDVLSVPAQHEAMVRTCRNLGGPVWLRVPSRRSTSPSGTSKPVTWSPLSDLFGHARSDVPIYGSGGFTTYDDPTTAAQLEGWITAGIPRVKIRSGRIGEPTPIATSHGLLSPGGWWVTRCPIRGRQRWLHQKASHPPRPTPDRGLQVSWLEEPDSSDDHDGLREVRDHCDADVAAGEYGYTVKYYTPMLAAGAVDCIQADVTRCGGYTAWTAVAHLAAANGIQISGHCAPNLHAHVAMSVANLRHVEYFYDHTRIEDLFFDGPYPHPTVR